MLLILLAISPIKKRNTIEYFTICKESGKVEGSKIDFSKKKIPKDRWRDLHLKIQLPIIRQIALSAIISRVRVHCTRFLPRDTGGAINERDASTSVYSLRVSYDERFLKQRLVSLTCVFALCIICVISE